MAAVLASERVFALELRMMDMQTSKVGKMVNTHLIHTPLLTVEGMNRRM
jgi:hypothetical protein